MSEITCKVAGVSYKNEDGTYRQRIIKTINPLTEVKLTIEREPENAYDCNAIKVLYNKQCIGYIPRDISEHIAPIMDKKGKVDVEFIKTSGGTSSSIGVFIKLTYEIKKGKK